MFQVRDSTKLKGLPRTVVTSTPMGSEDNNSSANQVQLRRDQAARASSGNIIRKKCRVLFSYQPKHDDELKLELEDTIDLISEVNTVFPWLERPLD